MARQQGPPPDYIDVAERIAEFRTKHPEGSLQQHALDFREFAGKTWVVYTAAAYRTPDDQRPGHGTAWEPVPGPTPFTQDSELQNAETSAWGRAIVAVLAADTKRGVASADEVRSRSSEARQPEPKPDSEPTELTPGQRKAFDAVKALDPQARQTIKEWMAKDGYPERFGQLSDEQADAVTKAAEANATPF